MVASALAIYVYETSTLSVHISFGFISKKIVTLYLFTSNKIFIFSQNEGKNIV